MQPRSISKKEMLKDQDGQESQKRRMNIKEKLRFVKTIKTSKQKIQPMI